MSSQALAEINQQASQIAAGIKILGPLSWPLEAEISFLSAWEQGQVRLPEIHYPAIDYQAEIDALQGLLKQVGQADPLEIFTRKTIMSYLQAAQMMQAVGTPRLQELSIAIYGQPGDPMPGCQQSNLELAQKLVNLSEQFDHPYLEEPELCVPAWRIRQNLETQTHKRLGADAPEFLVVDNLAAKATATSSTVRLRNATCFNRYDEQQLYVHEVMTHVLTAINGQKQPILSLMGQGAPRTTWTQEGLATFSEVITGAIDLNRLARLALRILAIDRALRGASFVETFEFFLHHGQSPKESFWSSARIFRGGYPDHQIIFTKDSVYLDGLLKVHSFFSWALMHRRIGLVHLLFCGRVALDDAFLLEAPLAAGLIAEPTYFPEWYEKIEGLAGILGFSLLTGLVDPVGLNDYYAQAMRRGPKK